MSIKSFRHSITGLVGKFPEEFADIFHDLVEVADDAEPLATPVPTEAVAEAAEVTDSEGSAQ